MKNLFKLLLITSFFNCLVWVIIIPVWQYPDEQSHFAQIQYMAEKGKPSHPTLNTSAEVALSEKLLDTERDGAGNNKFTYHPEFKMQFTGSLYGKNEYEIIKIPKSERSKFVKKEATGNPPLYYLSGSIFYRLFSFGSLITRVYAIRFMSILFFLGTVFVSYKFGQSFFNKNILLTLSLTSITAFLPMLTFSSTGILPDPLTNLLFSAFIFISIKIINSGFSTLKFSSLIVLIFLGSLTRQHFLLSLLFLPPLVLHQIITDWKIRKKVILMGTLTVLILFVAGFFFESLSFIRRLDFPESSGKNPGNSLWNMSFFEHFKWTLKRSYSETWPWYWGIYKWLSLSLPPLVYQIINRLIPFALLGILINLFMILRTKDFKKNFAFFFLIYVPLVYFLSLTVFDFFFRKNNGYSFGIQGRYFFPTIIAQISLLLTGFSVVGTFLLKNHSKWVLFSLIVLVMIFNLYTQAFLVSSYYDISSFSNFIKTVSQYKPLIFKGNIVYLILFLSLFFNSFFLFSLFKFFHREKNLVYN